MPIGERLTRNPLSPGIFRFEAKAGGFMMRSAVTEDRAPQGCNLSAGDGPKLAGVAFGLPLPVTLAKQGVEAFLLKVPVVRQHMGQSFLPHRLHRNAICQAVPFVRSGLI
jgi:hypothetical protein